MLRQAKEYFLMHKDIPVCLMEISEDGALGNNLALSFQNGKDLWKNQQYR